MSDPGINTMTADSMTADSWGNRVRIHQMRIVQGNPGKNAQTLLGLFAQDRADGIRLSIFPECALCGFLPAAEWLNPTLAQARHAAFVKIVEATSRGGAILFGATADWRGKEVSAIWAAENGRLISPDHSPLAFIPKIATDRDRFDRAAYPVDAVQIAYKAKTPVLSLFGTLNFSFLKVGAWAGAARELPDHYASQGARLLVRLDTFPYERHAERRLPASDTLPIVLCAGVGTVDMGKTFFVLPGGSLAILPNGNGYAAPFLQTGSFTLNQANSPLRPADHHTAEDVIRVMEAGLSARLDRLGLHKVIIGASGGIDSALAAGLYSRVLEPERLLLVNMPSRNNSKTTISLARQLAKALRCNYLDVPIDDSLALTLKQIDNKVCGCPATGKDGAALSLSPLAVENIQARDRSGRILAALSSAFGGVFTCNANKSESAIGYGTLYGDISGFFCALADLWKIEVWEIARCYNQKIFGREVIPQGSIDIVPSAELSTAQNVDEGKGDPVIYPYHDRVFASWTEWEEPTNPALLLKWYREGCLAKQLNYKGDVKVLFPEEGLFTKDLMKYWKLYHGLARAKRLQAPPVLSLKSRTFGFDLGTAQLPVIQ